MYSIDQLITYCGRQFALDLIPSLFIKISTASAEEKKVLIDLEYNNKNDGNVMPTFTFISDVINVESFKNKHLVDILCDLTTIMRLFEEYNTKIDIYNVDYIVFSYLGDFQLRFKNRTAKEEPFGKALYLDIQTVRIALIDEQIRRKWLYSYSIFKNGLAVFSGYFVFRYCANFLGWDFRKLIGI
jgi:hypothetical protein